jgi:hypothetical protein
MTPLEYHKQRADLAEQRLKRLTAVLLDLVKKTKDIAKK